MIKTRKRWLLLCYLVLAAAAVCELFVPGFLWTIATVVVAVILSAFLIAGFAGSIVTSKTLRAIGWVGIALFTLLVLWSSFFHDFHLASATWESAPSSPRPKQFDWRLSVVWVQNLLLVICYEKLGDRAPPRLGVEQAPDKRPRKFYIFGGYFLTALCSAYLTLKLDDVLPTGGIVIEQTGVSRTGVLWTLENFSNRSIYLLMDGDEVFAPAAATICRANDGAAEESEKLRAFTPVSLTTVKIVPGERVQLNVAASLPSRYRGGQCRLRLELPGGTFVESKGFTPP